MCCKKANVENKKPKTKNNHRADFKRLLFCPAYCPNPKIPIADNSIRYSSSAPIVRPVLKLNAVKTLQTMSMKLTSGLNLTSRKTSIETRTQTRASIDMTSEEALASAPNKSIPQDKTRRTQNVGTFSRASIFFREVVLSGPNLLSQNLHSNR